MLELVLVNFNPTTSAGERALLAEVRGALWRDHVEHHDSPASGAGCIEDLFAFRMEVMCVDLVAAKSDAEVSE